MEKDEELGADVPALHFFGVGGADDMSLPSYSRSGSDALAFTTYIRDREKRR